MNKAFEKILERLRRKVHNYYPSIDHYCLSEHAVKMSDIEKIVQEVAEEYNNGWIPCSEQLPKKDGFYLATLDGEIAGEEKPFSGLEEFENGKWVDDEEDYQCVLAWQPLPEPYKPEGE